MSELSLASELADAASRHTGAARDWHDPRNEACEHNHNIARDCTCKLVIPKGAKKSKPRIIFRVTDCTVEHGMKPELVVEIHDDGKMIIRESKRRVSYQTQVGTLYARLVKNHAAQVAREKALVRHNNRKSTKAVKRIAHRLSRRGKR